MIAYARNDLAKGNRALNAYAFGNLALFLVLMVLGLRDLATMLAVAAFAVFAYRRLAKS